MNLGKIARELEELDNSDELHYDEYRTYDLFRKTEELLVEMFIRKSPKLF